MALPTTYFDNLPNLLESGDYGLKISKPFFDATTAQDVNLVFNSAWPSLQIAFDTRASSTDRIAHGLGFPPFTLQWGGGEPYYGFKQCAVDDTYIYPFSGVEYVVAYNLDISHDVEYPFTTKSSDQTPYDPDYGIKFAKENKSIDSTDLRDFILHSRCQSPLVLAVKTEETYNAQNTSILSSPGGVVQFTQHLGYPTLNYGYVKGIYPVLNSTPVYLPGPMYSPAYPQLYSDGVTSYIEWSGTDTGASLVILRNPFFATTEIEATY